MHCACRHGAKEIIPSGEYRAAQKLCAMLICRVVQREIKPCEYYIDLSWRRT